jgi:hypothetical protein
MHGEKEEEELKKVFGNKEKRKQSYVICTQGRLHFAVMCSWVCAHTERIVIRNIDGKKHRKT